MSDVCGQCGHAHQEPGVGGICIGCPCPEQGALPAPPPPVRGGLSEQGVIVLRARIMAAHAAVVRAHAPELRERRSDAAELIASGQGMAYEHVLDMLADAVDSE